MENYSRFNISFERGEGVFLYDESGKKYIDMLAGIAVNTLGYAHPELSEVICNQAKKLIHVSNLFRIKPQEEVAEILVKNTFNDGKVFFCNSGAESNETAIKLARKYFYDRGYPQKYEILTFTGGFHGRTLGSLTATAQPKYHEGFKPLLQGIRYAEFNNVESLLENITENTAAIMFELIQGEGGVNPIDKNFLKKIVEISKEKDILIIVDEVQTGVGRTGKLYAYQHFNFVPDIITSAKGLAGGVPVGAVIARSEIAKAFTPGSHGSTFGGNYLAMVAAKVVLKNVLKEGFLKEVEEKGKYLQDKLKKIGLNPRGIGLMIGCPLPDNIDAKKVVERCLDNGLILGMAGKNTLRFVPPLIINYNEIDEAINILENVLKMEDIHK